ncbi:MAG TPA: sulfite exporter TauE/SafE family protein [Steroidobacteraceae bacterium]|nr:sulfite exporter TauE/SafE family protein [Steroidobacteraceae bacterium]
MIAAPLTIGAALAAGFAGSAHCAVMCGGIASAAGASFGAGARRPLGAALAFNGARLACYAAVGAALAATLGSLASAAPIPQLALGARLLAALLLAGLAVRLVTGRDLLGAERLGYLAWSRLRPAFGHAARLPPLLRPAALGALWGFMPCGLVYSVLLVAAATGRPLTGALTMLAFGAGTLPAMVGLTLGASTLGGVLGRPAARCTAGILILAAAAWTVAGAVIHPATHAMHGTGPEAVLGARP